MSINALKIRLGAPITQTMTFSGAQGGAQELGATTGGAELTYNPTILAVECDQALMAIASFKTKEEVTYDVAMEQYQISYVALVWAYNINSVITATGTPNTDTMYFGNYGNVPFALFDAVINKNDGTTNRLLLHLNKVYSAKSAKIGFYRDKVTTFDKLELAALADLTKPDGMQAGWIREEYGGEPIVEMDP